jgi:hypothetical protein
VIPQTPRHDFLHELHKLLKPASYLEIGVQTGRGLAQAIPPTVAVGVDPAPQISVPIAVRYRVATMTSDEFFAESGEPGERLAPVDLAFIDGMHLVEHALRDFMGVERHARPDRRTVAVFDDVLPYSADIAGRTPLPGDWAGDVWKIFPILDGFRPDLTLILVNVAPTGALVVLDLEPRSVDLAAMQAGIVTDWAREFTTAETASALNSMHRHTVGPAAALKSIRNHLNIPEA